MSIFHSSPEPFSVTREDGRVILGNRYLRCVHDREKGGALSEAVVKNGSGKNLFAKPQDFVIGIIEKRRYHCYRPCHASCEIIVRNDNPVLVFRSTLMDEKGDILDGLRMTLQIEYTPWGESLYTVSLTASRRIENLGMVQIGSLYPSASMNMLGIQNSLVDTDYPYGGGSNIHWYPLKKSNHTIFQSRYLPQTMLVFRQGLEGFQLMQGDHREPWNRIGGALPGFQMGLFQWDNAIQGFALRFSALDALRDGQYLEGTLDFKFSLSFPFVREKMLPLSPCSGNILHLERDFEHRWPEEADLQRLEDAGVTLMRFHNDGNTYNNGIFWRDAVYPPYPPEEMKKLDELLNRAHAHGIAVAPYFSVHEYHPDAPGFAQNSLKWGRLAAEGDQLIGNNGPNGYYGFQMCLNSNWYKMRIDTIDEVLRKHDFDGLYYDGCTGAECVNPEHGFWHRDYRKLMELLEWSKRRIGPEKPLYLHLTANPNLPAENMASLVLVEESGGTILEPEMFTPHAHFMNIAPRQVCCMLSETATDADHRRYALCALLYHATVSSNLKPYTDFYTEYRSEFPRTTAYRRHTAPGEGLCSVSNPCTGMSVYWNPGGGRLFFLINLSGQEEKTRYVFENGEFSESGEVTIPALGLTIIEKS